MILCFDLVSILLSNILGSLVKPWLELILLGERLLSPSILKLLGLKVDPIGIKLLVVFLDFRDLLLTQEEISKFIEIPVLVVVDFEEALILSAESPGSAKVPQTAKRKILKLLSVTWPLELPPKLAQISRRRFFVLASTSVSIF